MIDIDFIYRHPVRTFLLPQTLTATERRMTMEREDTPLELGTASVETKGPIFGARDMLVGSPEPTLSDD